MESNLVSVIVPVYNVEKYLEKCVNSIINQTYKNLELILVDDGSKDNSSKICDELAKKDKRIIVIHQENQGVSSARNTGLDICKGSFVTFIDSDDYIEKEYLSIMIEKLYKNNADLVICGYNQIMSLNIEKHTVGFDTEISQKDFTKGLLTQKGYGMNACKLYKREIIGNIRFDKELTVGEDTYFILNISKNLKKCLCITEILYNYNVNSESIVRKYNKNYLDNYMKSSKKIKEFVINNFDNTELNKLTNNYIIFTLTLVIINYCCNKERNQGKIFKQAKEIRSICSIKEYKEALKNISIKDFSKLRQVMILLIKMKMFILVSIMGSLRQKQIENKNK